jgi:hypothetical protein
MDRFWTLLEKSTLTSGVIAILLVVVACYCTIAQIPVPDYLAVALGTVVGFFFSSKAKDSEARAIRRLNGGAK